MPLFKTRSSLLEVQNRALIKTARERAERIDELERELQSAASQIGQLQRELQTAQERTGKFERDLQAVQDRTGNSNGTSRRLKGGPISNATSSRQGMRWSGSRWSASSIPRRHQR